MMMAIRLTKKNLHKILNESPIPRADLEAMIEEYDTPYINTSIYFVPQAFNAEELTHNSWMTLPWKALQNFEYDRDNIDTKFVEIKEKRNVGPANSDTHRSGS